jgi:hypothetical protein
VRVEDCLGRLRDLRVCRSKSGAPYKSTPVATLAASITRRKPSSRCLYSRTPLSKGQGAFGPMAAKRKLKHARSGKYTSGTVGAKEDVCTDAMAPKENFEPAESAHQQLQRSCMGRSRPHVLAECRTVISPSEHTRDALTPHCLARAGNSRHTSGNKVAPGALKEQLQAVVGAPRAARRPSSANAIRLRMPSSGANVTIMHGSASCGMDRAHDQTCRSHLKNCASSREDVQDCGDTLVTDVLPQIKQAAPSQGVHAETKLLRKATVELKAADLKVEAAARRRGHRYSVEQLAKSEHCMKRTNNLGDDLPGVRQGHGVQASCREDSAQSSTCIQADWSARVANCEGRASNEMPWQLRQCSARLPGQNIQVTAP